MTSTQPHKRKENPLLNIMCNVVVPSIIMAKFSSDKYLGQTYGLIIALLFPLVYGGIDLIRLRKINYFSIIGLVSVMLTGIFGIWGTSRNWITAKETAIPLIIGIAVLIAQWRGHPLMRFFLNQIIDLEKVKDAFSRCGQALPFQEMLNKSSYMLAGTFFLSAILNYILAVRILKGHPGSPEFVESLGKMTALSFPVIALPTTVIMGVIMWNIFNKITRETGLTLEDIIKK